MRLIADLIQIASPLPWLLPGFAIAVVASVVAGGAVARWLDVPRPVASVLLLSAGVILAITATPLAADQLLAPFSFPSCDFSRIGPADLAALRGSSDVTGNILMFMPLGFTIALAPRSIRKAAICAVAVCLPFLIEVTQLGVAALRRSCQSADVADNLTGLALGLACGTFAAWLSRRRAAKRSASAGQPAEEPSLERVELSP